MMTQIKLIRNNKFDDVNQNNVNIGDVNRRIIVHIISMISFFSISVYLPRSLRCYWNCFAVCLLNWSILWYTCMYFYSPPLCLAIWMVERGKLLVVRSYRHACLDRPLASPRPCTVRPVEISLVWNCSVCISANPLLFFNWEENDSQIVFQCWTNVLQQ